MTMYCDIVIGDLTVAKIIATNDGHPATGHHEGTDLCGYRVSITHNGIENQFGIEHLRSDMALMLLYRILARHLDIPIPDPVTPEPIPDPTEICTIHGRRWPCHMLLTCRHPYTDAPNPT